MGSPYRRLPFGEQADSKAPTELIPDNGIVERFHKTMLDEFYRIAFRKKLYETIDELQADLDAWMREFNEARPHQGKWCFGKTPMQPSLTPCRSRAKNQTRFKPTFSTTPHEPHRPALAVRQIKSKLLQNI